jgi:RNAse (barnase) inhibitor barstar
MLAVVGPRLPAIVAITLLLGLPASCAPVGANLGHDPCLLQQYQDHAFSTIAHIQGYLGTLTNRVDALAPQQGTINASQDMAETLTVLSEFQSNLGALWNALHAAAQPPEGLSFRQAAYEAIQRFDTGAQMLTQAYVDAGNGDTRAAHTIVTAARDWMHRGRLLLGDAAQDIAALPTNNPNC